MSSLRNIARAINDLKEILCALALLATGIGTAVYYFLGSGGNTTGEPAKAPPSQAVVTPAVPVAPVKRPFLSQLAVLRWIAADLRQTDAEQRPTRRYLTLVHLHNATAVKANELQMMRACLRELAQYLSPAGTVATFRPLDPEQRVLALNVTELAWDQKAAWAVLLRRYPYGLSLVDSPDPEIQRLAREVKELSGAAVPAIRADWLLQAVVRPPLGGASGELRIPPREIPAAVACQASNYAAQQLDLERAASELFLPGPAPLAALLQREERFRTRLGLSALLTQGTVSRQVWESTQFITSAYQEAAAELELGTPVVER